jgi:three-Cys-motif partner protein
MKNKDVKKNLLDHSQAKVRLLSEYLKRYLNIISNDGYTQEIEIFDLFCGEGIYENGGEGSPLVIMRVIKDIYFVNVAKLKFIPQINCMFNDIDPDKIERVKNAISTKSLYYDDFGRVEFTNIDYKDYLTKLIPQLKKLNKKKAFIFLDPYDYKNIKISHIIDILENNNSELLLWLPTQFMYRFESNGTPTALKDFIEEIIPYDKWNCSDSVWKFVNQLKDGFQNAIGFDYFVDHFTIQKNENTVFCLFFFTPHIKGFEKMLEAKWEIDTEQGKGWNYFGNQPSLFHETKTNPLEAKLLSFLESGSKTNEDIYEFTLRQGFLTKHTNEIFRNWQQIGKLEVLLHNGQMARKRAFYISYNYFRDDYSKVNFKLLV